MDHAYTSTTSEQVVMAEASREARATFLFRTYAHLFAALASFVMIEVLFFTQGWAENMATAMMGMNWMLILGAFVVVSWLATSTAHKAESLTVQYLALVGFVMAEAIIFVPLLWIAFTYAPGAITTAAGISLAGFAALTAIVFVTRKDFTFLGATLRWIGICALGGIALSIFTGFELGPWFSVAMIALAGGAILYDTSKVLLYYPEDRYVGAALELFASVAMLFWYVLRLVLASRD